MNGIKHFVISKNSNGTYVVTIHRIDGPKWRSCPVSFDIAQKIKQHVREHGVDLTVETYSALVPSPVSDKQQI